MKKLIICLLIITLISGCATAPTKPPTRELTYKNPSKEVEAYQYWQKTGIKTNILNEAPSKEIEKYIAWKESYDYDYKEWYKSYNHDYDTDMFYAVCLTVGGGMVAWISYDDLTGAGVNWTWFGLGALYGVLGISWMVIIPLAKKKIKEIGIRNGWVLNMNKVNELKLAYNVYWH